jgi:hypothetical protein
MSLDVQGRDPAEQLALNRETRRDQEPSADARTDFSPVRERPPQERPSGGDRPPEREDEDAEQDQEDGREPRKNLLRRHPVALAIGAVLLLAALPIGYLYWNYTAHFEYTRTPTLQRASSRSPPRYRAISRRSRSPITSMSTPAG